MLKKEMSIRLGDKKQSGKSLASVAFSPPGLPLAPFLTPMALAVALGSSAELHAQAANACGVFSTAPGAESAVECSHDADTTDSDAHTPYEDGISYTLDADDFPGEHDTLSLTIEGGDADNPTVVGVDGTSGTSGVSFDSQTSGLLPGHDFDNGSDNGPIANPVVGDHLRFEVEVGDHIWIDGALYRNTGEDVNGDAEGDTVFAALTIGTGQGETDPGKIYYQRDDGKFVKAGSTGAPQADLYSPGNAADVIDQSALDAINGAVVARRAIYKPSDSRDVLYASQLVVNVADGEPLIYYIGDANINDGANVIPSDVVLTVEEHVTIGIDKPGTPAMPAVVDDPSTPDVDETRAAVAAVAPVVAPVLLEGVNVKNYLADVTVNHKGQIVSAGNGINAEAVYATSVEGDVVAATATVLSSGDITVMTASAASADGISAKSSATTVTVSGGEIKVEGMADGGTASAPITRRGISAEGATSSYVKVGDATITAVKPAEARDAQDMVTNQAELDDTNAVVQRQGIHAKADGQARVLLSAGTVESDHRAIWAEGAMAKVTVEDASEVTSNDEHGVFAQGGVEGAEVTVDDGEVSAAMHGLHAEATGDSTVTVRGGKVAGGGAGILARGVNATADIDVSEISSVSVADPADTTTPRTGVGVKAWGTMRAEVTVGERAKVSGDNHGIHIQGNETQTVQVDGTVTGGQGAAVNFGKIMTNDPVTDIGTQLTRLTVGANGEVKAGGGAASKAVVAQAETGDVQIVVEVDDKGVGKIDGRIIHLGGDDHLEFIARFDGKDTELEAGKTTNVIISGVVKGAFDGNNVLPFELKLADSTATDAARDWLLTTEERSFDRETAVYAPRARVYEALPSVLLSMNDLTSWRDRMAAPRDSKGVWVRLGAGSGDREADSSTSLASGIAYDLSSQTAQVGGDFTADNVLLGLSLHHRSGDADVDSGGEIDVTGQGVGLSATYIRENGFYLDGQMQMTWYNDVELTSDARGDLSDDAEGRGHAFGIELGQAITKGDRVITPRLSLTWSSVDFDDFAVMFGENDGGQVSLKDGDVFSGSIGVIAEIPFKESSGFFISADFEHNFGSDTSVEVSGDRLSSDIAEDWAHFGVGGFMKLGEASSLQATANYSSASGSNDVLTGSVKLTYRF